MDQVTQLLNELDGQLTVSTKLASNRAEHLRLQQIRATVDRLRATVTELAPAE